MDHLSEDRIALLLVDDDPGYLRATKRALGDEFVIHTADSAAAGLDLLTRVRVDVVISDLEMPILDGVGFLKRVAENHPHVLRALLSGHELTPEISATLINEAEVVRVFAKTQRHREICEGIRKLAPRVQLARLAELSSVGARETGAISAWVEQRFPGTLRLQRRAGGVEINSRALAAALSCTSWQAAAALLR